MKQSVYIRNNFESVKAEAGWICDNCSATTAISGNAIYL